jgi:hypothetical protein
MWFVESLVDEEYIDKNRLQEVTGSYRNNIALRLNDCIYLLDQSGFMGQ